MTIDSWVQGNIFAGTNSSGVYTQGQIPSPHKPAVLLDSAGRIFGKPHPQYANYHISQFVSVRDEGATGDGKTDDTEAIKRALGKVGMIVNLIYFPSL